MVGIDFDRKKRGVKGHRPGRRLQTPQLKQSDLRDLQVSLAMKIHTWKGYTFYLKAQDPDSEKIENVWIYQQILIQANAEKLWQIYKGHNLNPEYK